MPALRRKRAWEPEAGPGMAIKAWALTFHLKAVLAGGHSRDSTAKQLGTGSVSVIGDLYEAAGAADATACSEAGSW